MRVLSILICYIDDITCVQLSFNLFPDIWPITTSLIFPFEAINQRIMYCLVDHKLLNTLTTNTCGFPSSPTNWHRRFSFFPFQKAMSLCASDPVTKTVKDLRDHLTSILTCLPATVPRMQEEGMTFLGQRQRTSSKLTATAASEYQLVLMPFL